jgi:hypothetical protein
MLAREFLQPRGPFDRLMNVRLGRLPNDPGWKSASKIRLKYEFELTFRTSQVEFPSNFP